MGLPEVETSPQPSAASQSSFRWSYRKHGRSEDSGAELATNFASVVLPLFWKTKLDRVQFPSSAENSLPRTNIFQHKSITTEDLAVLGSLDNNGTSSYSTGWKRDRHRREAGLGVLTAVRSEGDLRCKYSAALSSARCFDPEPQKHKRGSRAETDFATVEASFYWDTGVQWIPRRPERFRIASRGLHHSALCAGERNSPHVFRSAQRLKHAHETHTCDTGTAENVERSPQNARTLTTLRALTPPECLQRSAHSGLPTEPGRQKVLGGSALKQAFHNKKDIFQPEILLQGTCSSASESQSQRFSATKQEQDMTEFSGIKLGEELKRTEIERAHGRMREHMADMLRFLDRMQGKHLRRRTTAAFRLRAAKVSDGPGTISYAALHCLSGVAGGQGRERQSSPESVAAHGIPTARTPPTASLLRPVSDAAAGWEDDDAGRKMRRCAAAASIEEERTKQRKGYSSATKNVENQAATERGGLVSAAQKATLVVTAERVDVDAVENSGEAGEARKGLNVVEVEKVYAAASFASTPSEEVALDIQVIAETGDTQPSVAADDAKPSTATAIPLRQESVSMRRFQEEYTDTDRSVAGKETVGGPSALEGGALNPVKDLAKQRWVLTARRSKESGCVGDPSDVASRRRKTTISAVAARARRQRTPPAAKVGDKWICIEDGMKLGRAGLETGSSKSDLKKTTTINSLEAVTEESKGNVEEHRNPRIMVYGGGQEVKSGGTSLTGQQKPCTAEDHLRACRGEAAPFGLMGTVVVDKQLEPLPDATISLKVARPNLERGSCEKVPGEFAERRQRVEPAQPEAVQAAEVHAAEESGSRERGELLKEMRKEACEENTSTEGRVENVLPTDVSQREMTRAEFQIRQKEEVSAGTADIEAQCKRQLKIVLKHVADGSLDPGTTFQQDGTGTLQQQTVESMHNASVAVGPEDVFFREEVQQKLTEIAGPKTSGEVSESAFEGEHGIFYKEDVNAAVLKEDKNSKSGEGTQLECIQLQSVGRNRCAEQQLEEDFQAANKANKDEGSRLEVEVTDETESTTAQLQTKDKSGTAYAAKDGSSAAEMLAAEILEPEPDISTSRMPCVGAENTVEFAATSSSLKEGENTEENGSGVVEKEFILSMIPPAGKDMFQPKSLRSVFVGREFYHAISAVDNAQITTGISGKDIDVPAPLSPAASGCGQALGFVEESHRFLGEKEIFRRNVKGQSILEEQKEVLLSTNTSFEQWNGARVVGQDDPHTETTEVGKNLKQPAGNTSIGKRDRLDQQIRSFSEENYPSRKSPVLIHEVVKVEGSADPEQSQTSTETPITRANSRASTVPSSFGTICLSSQEDLLGEEGSQVFPFARRETEPPSRHSVASETQPEAQLIPQDAAEIDITTTEAATHHTLGTNEQAAVRRFTAMGARTGVADEKTNLSSERLDGEAVLTVGSVCRRCGARDTDQQYFPNFATCVPPFLRKRGHGGAYTNQELMMLSGGFWYENSGAFSFRMAPVSLCRPDPAYLASQAAGRRARAIQQNLLLSIERDMRLSRRRLRSMFYWPKSFVHACASAVHTKATMMAAGSLVGPLRQSSPESEGCCYCVPNTCKAETSSRSREQSKFLEGEQSTFCRNANVSHLQDPVNSEQGYGYVSSVWSLEKLALVDCSWCCNPRGTGDGLGNRAEGPKQVAPNGGMNMQYNMSSALRGQRGGLQHGEVTSQNSRQPSGMKQRLVVEKSKGRIQQGHGSRWPQSFVHQTKHQSFSSVAAHHSPVLIPPFNDMYRPPLIARWSLTDAQVVEVAGTFSSSPWKDLYRMQRDRLLGGFTLDLYSVAPQDMLLQQERFVGIRVDDRHRHVLPRGWWVCPLYPTAKKEAVLQVAVKFRVDGVWRCEPMLPIHRDEHGRSVNVLVVYQGQHVTSPQKGQTQYFFEGLDLSPLTYNPSRSPAYQTDGPVLVQPSDDDLELEESLMSHQRRCWNPPSGRPLMSKHFSWTTETALSSSATDAAEGARKDEHAEGYGGAAETERSGGEEKETGNEETKQDAVEELGEAQGRVETATDSAGASLRWPQTTVNECPRTQTAKHTEPEQQRQQSIADVGVECCGEHPHADSVGHQFEADGGELTHHPTLFPQGQKEKLVRTQGNTQQVFCCGAGDQKRQLGDRKGADEEKGIVHQSRSEAGKPVSAEALTCSRGEKGEKGRGGNAASPQEGCLQVSSTEAASEVRADIRMQMQSEREQNRPLSEGKEAFPNRTLATDSSAEGSQKACDVAAAQSSERRATSETQECAATVDADDVAPASRPPPLLTHQSVLWNTAGQEGEKRQKAVGSSGSNEMLLDDMSLVRPEERIAAASTLFEELEAVPAGGIAVRSAPEAACNGVGEKADDRSGPKLTGGRTGAATGGAGKVDARSGARETSIRSNTFREGKVSATLTPRLNRGFSAYGSTLGVAKEEQSAPTGEGNCPIKSPATGALRRVSTLGDGYWPTRVTKYLQTPEVFYELSGLNVAGRRTSAEGARMKRGLTLQCGSYMIPHPDKTESGGADAFFLATPVPPSSRYSKRFACMDVPLARSSTPPLRSIPRSRQQGSYSVPQAEEDSFKDRSGGSPHMRKLPDSALEISEKDAAATESSVGASIFFSALSSDCASAKTLSPDFSTNTSEPPFALPPNPSTDRFLERSADATDPAAEVPATGEGQPRQSRCKAIESTTVNVDVRNLEAPAVTRCGTANAASFSVASTAASSCSHPVNNSVAGGTTSITFSSGITESDCSCEIGDELPEDEASAVQMLLREALEENANSGLAQVLSACSPSCYGTPSSAIAGDCQDERRHYSVSGSFICAGAAVCTPPRRPAGAPTMIAGGYGSAAKGVVIGSGGELGGAVCVGVADGVGEWDSFGLNPRLFAEELMRGCWTAAHEEWFWEVAAVEKRALEVLKRGYKAARSFGSCTALVACLDTRSEKIGIANLGDSGVIILRRQHQPRLVYSKMTCVHRSKEQQHNFNCPYQLSRLPSPSQYQQLVNDGKHSLVRVLRSATMLSQDTPEMADVYTVNTLEGDLILLGTDGVFDNLFDHEICALANAALSPYEAALLNKESLATSADAVAAAVAEAAAHRSRDPLAKTPFMRHARRAQTHFVGGKMDDITVVACWVTRGQLPPDYLMEESESA